jgi:uncharacterized protein YjbI with pentapeptide repeats
LEVVGLSKPPRLPIEPELPASFEPAPGDLILLDAELEARSFEGVDLTGRNGEGLRLVDGRLRSTDLTEATLSRARLRDVVVLEGNWANVKGSDASLSRVRFERVRLTGADLSGSSLDNVTFSECRLDLCSFRFTRLEVVHFEGCRMQESDFYDAQLDSVMFADCDLSGVTLTGATFTGSEMRGCDLSAAHSPERLRNVRMPWSDVMRTAAELAVGIGIEVLDD